MRHVVQEIAASKLKPYAIASRACRFASTCELESKFGVVSFDFSSFQNVDYVVFQARRKSGNGKAVLVSGNRAEEYGILSKYCQDIGITVAAPRIDFKRTARGTGSIEILKAILYSSKPRKNYDWTAVLNSAVDYKHMRIVDDKLMASEGAYLKAAGINSILTNPPDIFVVNKNVIDFKGNCEIIDLNIIPASQINTQQYHHVESPDPILTPAIPDIEDKKSEVKVQHSRNTNINVGGKKAQSTNVIYDSKGIDWIQSSNAVANQYVKVTKNFVRMSHKGMIAIPIGAIQPSYHYIAVLDCISVNGNGKMQAQIAPSGADNPQVIVATVLRRNININVYSSLMAPDVESFRLVINRPIGATGEIVIYRVMLVKSRQMVTYHNDMTYMSDPDVANMQSVQPIKDTIHDISRSFATIKKELYKPYQTFEDVKGVIEPLTFSSNQWLNKAINHFPKVKIKSNLITHQSSINETDVVIANLGFLKKCDKIWLENFIFEPSKKDIDILKQAKKIYSSSLPNIQMLRRQFKNQIEYIPRIWPTIQPSKRPPLQQKYVLYFDRNKSFTKQMISAYLFKELPKLVIVGGRGNYPNPIKVYNEHTDYDTIYSLIINAACLLDLPKCNHYMSAILDLAFMANVPIVTTNHWMSIAKPPAVLLKSQFDGAKGIRPVFSSITPCLKHAMKGQRKKIRIDPSYNLNLYAIMKNILGNQ